MDVSKFYRKSAYDHYVKNNDDPQIVEENKGKFMIIVMILFAIGITLFCFRLFSELPKSQAYIVSCNLNPPGIETGSKHISQIFVKKGKELSKLKGVKTIPTTEGSIIILPTEYMSKCKANSLKSFSIDLVILS